MKVSEAIKNRHSVRAFLNNPVSTELIKKLLSNPQMSIGGNLQPWKIYVINEDSMKDFLKFQSEWSEPETPAYDIYPEILKSPTKVLVKK